MSETLREIIVLVGPYVLALLTVLPSIISWIKTLMSIRAMRKEMLDMKEMKEVKKLLLQVLEENQMLKEKLNETMTIIDRVQRKN